jgi:hypothetical protein
MGRLPPTLKNKALKTIAQLPKRSMMIDACVLL